MTLQIKLSKTGNWEQQSNIESYRDVKPQSQVSKSMCRGESIQNCLWNICAPCTIQVFSIWNAKICPNGLYFYRFSYIYASVWHKCFLNKVSAETAWNEVKLEEYMQCLSAAVFVTLLAQHTHTHTQKIRNISSVLLLCLQGKLQKFWWELHLSVRAALFSSKY